MTIEYVKHDREVTTDQLNRYGKFATHDIHVPVLLMYELGKIPDRNGTMVNVNLELIHKTLTATNNWLEKRHKSPFARLKSFWSKPLNEVEAISIIKDHNTSEVNNTVGHVKGLLRIEVIDGIKALLADAVIKDPDAKEKINGDLLRSTSVGLRPDGSLKEVSFVINEAIPHGGLLMSESTKASKEVKEKSISKEEQQEIEFAEEMAALEFQESELNQTTIPNHLVISRMIKSGKVPPYKYDQLIKCKDRSILELMEGALPSVELGIMRGTIRPPARVDVDDMMIDKIINNYQNNKKTAVEKKQDIKQQIEIIQQEHSFEEDRRKELKHILELAEVAPDILTKYIKIELGEIESSADYSLPDTLLSEYIQQVKDIRQKINNLKLGVNI